MTRSRRRLGAANPLVALLSLSVLAAGSVSAQQGGTAPPAAPQHRQPDSSPLPSPKGARPILPQARADGARPLDRSPHTAEEKSKALSNLYAQLAAAEDEQAAKKLTAAIERLWRISGSDTVDLLVGRAAKAMTQDRMGLAGKLLDSAVEMAPDYPEAFNQRAFLHFKQNDYRAAVGDLRRALALDPNHYKALEGLAQIWRETGDKRGALGVMRQLLDVNPHAPGAQKAYDDLKREFEGQRT